MSAESFLDTNLFIYQLEARDNRKAPIDAGEIVSSYYVVWDPTPINRVLATLTFPDTIIGVITQQAELQNSEFLGDASATYLNPSLLGLEGGDTATFAGATLSVDFDAGSPGDYIRVIVGAPDTDGDGVVDALDNCIVAANPSQIDADADGFGNACDADFNNDCVVNAVDLGYLRTVFFSVDEVGDLNGDGVVNAVDLGLLRVLFFMPPGPSGLGDCVPDTRRPD